jgi:hypothetical protein
MMNERIRELEKQCWDYKPGFDGQEDWYTVFNKEKFAELIVRECIASIPSVGHRGDFYRAVEFCQLKIKEHFGVEE